MAEITKFEIDMLSVGAADAFLLHAFIKNPSNGEWEYIVLIDAGNEGDGKKILKHIEKYYHQQYVDLAICTHCDSDHYGGFKELIDEHNNSNSSFEIKNFWVHDPYNHVDLDDVKYVRTKPSLRERLKEAYAFNDGSNLLDLIDAAKIKREEPFTGTAYSLLNIEVLGPDKDYYESLIPGFRLNLDFKDEQEDEEYNCQKHFSQTEDEFYSKALEDAPDDGSSVNQSSVILCFEAKGNKYIFTGDAGKDALHRIVDNDERYDYANIRWLKIPHHGSKHNLDNAIISHFHPDTSYISTEKYGKYASRCTVFALKKVGGVYSTHKHGNMQHQSGTKDRDGYSSAKSL